MSDDNLLVFGCAVAFTALAGAYIYIRECYLRDTSAAEGQQRDSVALPVTPRDHADHPRSQRG